MVKNLIFSPLYPFLLRNSKGLFIPWDAFGPNLLMYMPSFFPPKDTAK